jgi:hypothetical protein
MDPMIEEFCRAHELRPEVFRRMQRYFATEVGPRLEALQAENAQLRATLAAASVKRGPGRPRKTPVVVAG